MAKRRWSRAIEDLREDNRSGAEEIASRALDALLDEVGDSVPGRLSGYRRWLLRTSRELVASQPSMGVLFRLVNDMLWATDGAATGTEARQSALDHLQGHHALLDAAADATVDHGCEALSRHGCVMTHSRSSTVVRTLTAIASRGGSISVLCGESRPMLEGQALASELAWAGLEVRIGVDMALHGWLHEADALVVGADSIMAEGLVNKLGTSSLASAAYELGIPCIVLSTTTKFLPDDYAIAQSLRAGDPEEIMPVSNDNIQVSNPYFDITPLELVTTVVTERGPMARPELLETLSAIRTYPGLRGH